MSRVAGLCCRPPLGCSAIRTLFFTAATADSERCSRYQDEGGEEDEGPGEDLADEGPHGKGDARPRDEEPVRAGKGMKSHLHL